MPARRAATLFALVALLAIAPAASAHAYLESATPAPGGSVPEGASIIALRFTEPVEKIYTTVEIRSVQSGDVVPATLAREPGEPNVVRAHTPPLERGVYDVEWRTLGVDGHTARGSYSFAVGEATVAESSAPLSRAPEAMHRIAFDGLLRSMLAWGLVLALGIPFFAAHVSPRTPRLARVAYAAALVGLVAASALVVFAQARLSTHPSETLRTVGVVLLLAQVAFLLGAALVFRRAVELADAGFPRGARLLSRGGLLALGAVAVHALGGHALAAAAATEGHAAHFAMLSTWLHLVAVAVWTGGVVGFVAILPGARAGEAALAIRRFSPWALASALVLALTGVHLATHRLADASEITGTGYGLILVVKSILFLALLGLGAYHRFRTRPRLESGPSGARPPRALRHAMRGEAALMAVVLLAAGVLAAAPLPERGVDTSGGPLAAQARAVQLDGLEVRLLVHPDPLRVGMPQLATVHLADERFAGAEDARIMLRVASPDGSVHDVAATKTGFGTWETAAFTFQAPGENRIDVLIERGTRADRATFAFDVRDVTLADIVQ